MVFTSEVFILAFLPIVILVFTGLINYWGRNAAIVWLVISSLFFYGWWNWSYLLLISISVSCNYGMGVALSKNRSPLILGSGIALNLLALGYYKYTNFILETVGTLTESSSLALDIALPLAISFFTFQQIAYLVDVYQGKTSEMHFLKYGLFVCFFPQFIAGPIVHHSEVIPQFSSKHFSRFKLSNLLVGLTIFAIGFDKKVFIADSIATIANPIFDNSISHPPGMVDAWVGSLAYTFQLYFDFSGYSDMAIGLARIFGIKLPVNFNSPYKATNIIDFWRRWHMTLSRFLRDYLYLPLGGNRNGPSRRYANIMIVMLLGGLWHGAGWNFVIWGGLHGLYLALNHGWRNLTGAPNRSRVGLFVGRTLTFLAVVVSWVFFRAEGWPEAVNILVGMFGGNGMTLPHEMLEGSGWFGDLLAHLGVQAGQVNALENGAIGWICLLWAIVWFAPNTQELMARYQPTLDFDNCHVRPHISTVTNWLDSRRAFVLIPLFSGSVLIASLLSLSRGAISTKFIYMIF